MTPVLNTGDAAARRYRTRIIAFTVPYVLICVAAMGGVFDELAGKPVAWLLALAVSAPVIGQFWAALVLMRDSDEYVRAVMARRFILASGLALAGATLWGFGESFAGAPHLPAWLVGPLFWAAFGLVTPFVRDSRG